MIDNTFNKLLTEEMGIIRNVQTDTTAIADKIKHLIKNTASSPTSFDMTTYKNGIFQIDVTTSVDGNVSQSKKTIKVKWYYFSFSDEQTKEDAITKIPMRTSYNKSINTLSIVVLAIRGVIDSNTLEDSIAHELTHNFQTHLKGDKLLSNDNIKAYSRYSRKLTRMYAQALADIRNKNIMESETYHTMHFYMQPPMEELKKRINKIIFD